MKQKPMLTIMLLSFLAGAAFAVYHIYGLLSEYHTSNTLYQDVQQYASFPEEQHSTDTEPVITETIPQTYPTEPAWVYPTIDFASLKQINEDVTAWIYIEGTNINYPVVQGTDNRYYVSTLVDGSYNSSGSIFLDYRNQPDFSDPHCILYGHNMQNGSMFHDICNYKDPEFYASHPVGFLISPEHNFHFEVVSAYVASLADPAWQLEFVDDADLQDWLPDTIERSSFVTSVQPQPGDQVITLSTCSYEYDNARFVLVGILKEEE